MKFKLSQRNDLLKSAQLFYKDPEQTAAAIATIIKILGTYISPENEISFRDTVRRKIHEINPGDLASKKMPAGARIGQAITLIKSFLNGQEERFVYETLQRLAGKL